MREKRARHTHRGWPASDLAPVLMRAEVRDDLTQRASWTFASEWVVGDHITLVRNEHYLRAAEGLPYLDQVTFRFVPDLGQALDLFAAGECDVIAQDVIEGSDITPLLKAAETGVSAHCRSTKIR